MRLRLPGSVYTILTFKLDPSKIPDTRFQSMNNWVKINCLVEVCTF